VLTYAHWRHAVTPRRPVHLSHIRDSLMSRHKHCHMYSSYEKQTCSLNNPFAPWKIHAGLFTDRSQFSFGNYDSVDVIKDIRKLQPWSQGLEKIILYTFCPSPPLCNVDKTLSSNTSLHFTIFQHWKEEWGCWHLFCRYYDYNFMFLAFSNTICPRL